MLDTLLAQWNKTESNPPHGSFPPVVQRRFHGSQYAPWSEAFREVHKHFRKVLVTEYRGTPRPCGIRWKDLEPMQWPNDLLAYDEVIRQTKPRTLIETGTHQGHTTMYFADCLDRIHPDGRWQILTMELLPTSPPKWEDARIKQFIGHSPDFAEPVRDACAAFEGPVMLTLDSDHTAKHVLAEIAAFSPLVTPGQFMIVQDTWCGFCAGMDGEHDYHWHALGAVEALLDVYPNDWEIDNWPTRYLAMQSPFGFLRRR